MAKQPVVVDRTESQLPIAVPEPANLARVEPTALAGEPSIMRVIAYGIEKGTSIDVMEKLYALARDDADRKALREFSAAMAAFQAECPPIRKTSSASIVTKAGAKYGYTYAELDEIARTVGPFLHKHGLSYSWDSSEDKGSIVCTCIVKHANGHRETAKFSCPTDSAAAMSGAQRQAAALTYARRQSLVQALGLTTADPDTDGADDVQPVDPTPITETQAANLDCLIDEVKADRKRMLAHFGVETLADLPAARFKEAIEGLERKRSRA